MFKCFIYERLFKNFNQREDQDHTTSLKCLAKMLFLLCQREVRMCSILMRTCENEKKDIMERLALAKYGTIWAPKQETVKDYKL